MVSVVSLPAGCFRAGKSFVWDPPVTVPCKIPEEIERANDRAPADVDIITYARENGKKFQKATKVPNGDRRKFYIVYRGSLEHRKRIDFSEVNKRRK